MAEQLPPDWAIGIALRKSGYFVTVPAEVKNGSMIYAREAILGFARNIASKEEAPVDPLLIEATEIAGYAFDDFSDRDFATGVVEKDPKVAMALEALRRGIEIGKAQA